MFVLVLKTQTLGLKKQKSVAITQLFFAIFVKNRSAKAKIVYSRYYLVCAYLYSAYYARKGCAFRWYF